MKTWYNDATTRVETFKEARAVKTPAEKREDILQALSAMPIGACGVKWDCVVWRVSETGWIVGEDGVRKDGFVHDMAGAVDWLAWKRKFHNGEPGGAD